MEKLLIDFVSIYGPMGFGWIVAGVLWFSHAKERREWVAHLDSHRTALEQNSLVTAELVTYLKAKLN